MSVFSNQDKDNRFSSGQTWQIGPHQNTFNLQPYWSLIEPPQPFDAGPNLAKATSRAFLQEKKDRHLCYPVQKQKVFPAKEKYRGFARRKLALLTEHQTWNYVIIQASGFWYLTLASPCHNKSAKARNSFRGSLLLIPITEILSRKSIYKRRCFPRNISKTEIYAHVRRQHSPCLWRAGFTKGEEPSFQSHA